MKPCPEFLDPHSPEGVSVYQLTPEEKRSEPVYPDSPGFLEGGRSLLLQTSSGPQICHFDDGGRLEPLRDRVPDLRGARLAGDGRHVVCTRGEPSDDTIVFHRMDLFTGEIEKVFIGKGTLPGTLLPVTGLHIETTSWDGTRLGAHGYLDYQRKCDGAHGIVILDTEIGRTEVVFSQRYPHAHLRYCPSPEPTLRRTLMVQHHHEREVAENGKEIRHPWSPDDRGVDLHVLRDDGSGWSDLPFGRDGDESCIGHQVWHGEDGAVAAVMLQNRDNSYGWADGTRQHAVTGTAVPSDPGDEHCGARGREAYRRYLSRPEESPRLCHLHADRSGLRFTFDTFPVWSGDRAGMAIYLGESREFGGSLKFRYLLNTGTVLRGGCHAHPILSPDGDALFFTSDYHGSPQAYMVTGLPWENGGPGPRSL